MDEYYTQRGADTGPNMYIEFESDSIHLEIPKLGVFTEDHLWRIVPLSYPPKVIFGSYS